MKQYENDCCDCATESYPCLGESCGMRHVPHYYCDECGDEAKLFILDGQELCISCIEEKLEAVEGSY